MLNAAHTVVCKNLVDPDHRTEIFTRKTNTKPWLHRNEMGRMCLYLHGPWKARVESSEEDECGKSRELQRPSDPQQSPFLALLLLLRLLLLHTVLLQSLDLTLPCCSAQSHVGRRGGLRQVPLSPYDDCRLSRKIAGPWGTSEGPSSFWGSKAFRVPWGHIWFLIILILHRNHRMEKISRNSRIFWATKWLLSLRKYNVS